MTDTAQPEMAAENGELTLEEAANAFKTPAPEEQRNRDDRGRFASDGGDEEIEAEAGPEQGEEEAENHDDDGDDDGAADEAQPTDVDLPTTWAEDKAEMWAGLPPEAQAYIAERDGQIKAASERKFEEAANVRKAAEAAFAEAQTSRDEHVAAIDQMLNLLEMDAPTPDQFVVDGQYDNFSYDQAVHSFNQSVGFRNSLNEQRRDLVAQRERATFQQDLQTARETNRVHGPELVALVPELGDPDKANAALGALADYAISQGTPQELIRGPRCVLVDALDWKFIWKAQQWDKSQAARAKVRTDPKPQPKPQPAIRPGVAAPRVAQQQARFKGASERLARSGSIEDAAAVFKLMK